MKFSGPKLMTQFAQKIANSKHQQSLLAIYPLVPTSCSCIYGCFQKVLDI